MVRFNLLNQLERAEIKHKGFLLQNDDHYFLAQLEVLDWRVEGDISSVFAFLIVPNH